VLPGARNRFIGGLAEIEQPLEFELCTATLPPLPVRNAIRSQAEDAKGAAGEQIEGGVLPNDDNDLVSVVYCKHFICNHLYQISHQIPSLCQIG
jgi:hypothetical protein